MERITPISDFAGHGREDNPGIHCYADKLRVVLSSILKEDGIAHSGEILPGDPEGL